LESGPGCSAVPSSLSTTHLKESRGGSGGGGGGGVRTAVVEQQWAGRTVVKWRAVVT
jgi:hypothetical protein